MVRHSSTLAWKIPWMEEPGRLQSMGLRRLGHDRVTSLSLFTFMHWRRKWQPTPVFLPGESQGRGSLMDCCLQGRTESDTTEVTQQQQQHQQSQKHILYDSVYMKCPEWGNLQKQKVDQQLPELRVWGWEWGEAANGSGVSLESDESVLKLDYGDGCPTL